jgi:uncharacterized protein (TIGR00730 family)
MGLAAGDLRFASLFEEPGNDAFAMVSLDFDDSMFARTPGSAMAFQRLGNVVGFVRREAVDEADDACAAPLAGDANDAVGGHCGFGHAIALRMSRFGIFCGAHAGREGRYQTLAEEIAGALVAQGHGIVYGGGRVGLMGALADAMLQHGGEVVGVIPSALATQEVAHGGVTELHVVDTMHERKALMAKLSDAFIALPGGFGTMDEFHEIVTWRQLRIHDKPIGLLNAGGFYDHLLALYERMESEGFLSPNGRALFVSAPDIGTLLQRLR